MNNNKARINRITAILLIQIFVACSSNALAQVKLKAESDKKEYVVGEPVKLVVKLLNESAEEIRIPDINYLGINMKFMFYEVVAPNGKKSLRKFEYITICGYDDPKYEGAALSPGDSVVTYLYPNVTHEMRHEIRGARAVSLNQKTFPRAGVYNIRVGYRISEFRENLWKPPGGDVLSNNMVIEVKNPNPVEREIIEAIWALGTWPVAVGDMKRERFDDEALKHVIEKYPENPMIKHAKFALAKSYLANLTNADAPKEAIKILKEITAKYPGFRKEEVYLQLGVGYLHSREPENAVHILTQGLRDVPQLVDCYEFMRIRVLAQYGDAHVTGNWMRARREGKQQEFEEELKNWGGDIDN